MPHLIVEATPELARAIDFATAFARIHRRLADMGSASLDDVKSRMFVTDSHLAGADLQAEFIVARLTTTNPRPPEVRRAMAAAVHVILTDAIAAEPRAYWWQCCVLLESVHRADYCKTDSRA